MQILQITDDKIIVRGHVPERIIEEEWMPIKKKGLIIPKSIVMTHQYDAATGCTTFAFYVAINVVEKSNVPGYIINGQKRNYSPSQSTEIHRYLLNQATAAFADKLLARCDGDTPDTLHSAEGAIYA